MLAGQPLTFDNELTLFIRDAFRFISAFIIPISQSAPHVYLSALPFAPEESYVVRKFGSRFPNTFVVTQGKPSQWPMAVFTAEHQKDSVKKIAFSPDESTFLYISRKGTYICDSETGRCILGSFRRAHVARFSPARKHILLQYSSYAAVWDIETGEKQFRIEGFDFAFVRHDGRIASMKKGGNSSDSGDEDPSGILVQFWEAGNGQLIYSRTLEVNDGFDVRFSPDGHFLAIQKNFEGVLELWNLEDSKDFRRFTYPCGEFKSLCFSPTSDTLMVKTRSDFTHRPMYLWRLDTQEMVSFSCDSSVWSLQDVIHSPLTNYLFILQDSIAEIWDVSATGSKVIWKHASLSGVTSICPSSNGHRFLVGYRDGSVRMWNLDLENLVMNQADTTNTRDDSDEQRSIGMSPSGKMVIIRPWESSKVKFMDTATRKVVASTDIECIKDNEYRIDIAFSPDEEQVAFSSKSLITICDMMHPEKSVSFDPWPGKGVWERKVAFRTCNDLVICTVSRAGSGLLQVWHRQDLTGFECTYSFSLKKDNLRNICLAPDGLTVIIVPRSPCPPFLWNHETAQIIVPLSSYSWNHDAARFHPVRFDDQVHISQHPPPQYSPDGKLFACRSGYHVRVWDTRTGHLVSTFLASKVDVIALSPALTHSLGERLIALSFECKRVIHLFGAYTGHLHAQILGEIYETTAFIRDGTALANYYYTSGVRIWEIADLTVEHRHSTHGYELMLRGIRDGWMMGQGDEPLFWVPVENRKHLYMPSPRVVIEEPDISTIMDYSNLRFSRNWTECIDKEWLKELEQKEKEGGKWPE